jgi:hypothetical protein
VGRTGAEETARPTHEAIKIDVADDRHRMVIDHRSVDGRVDSLANLTKKHFS